jgi:hypothetical protein
MSSSSRRSELTTLLGGGIAAFAGVAMTMLLIVTLLGAIISAVFGTGLGGGPEPCSPATTTPTPVGQHGGSIVQYSTGIPVPGTPTVVPSATPGCLPPSGIARAVVALAQQMAAALYVNPSCGGHISFPNCYYTWYNGNFPQSVIAYGNQVCPGCYAWANGTYQCVSFVRGAYSQAYPMPWTANAFDLWALYQGKPGWMEIPSGAAPPGQRGMPLPGDAMVFKDSSIGHVAIVMSVLPPSGGQNGAITFANANSVSPYTTMPFLPDLSVDTSSWPGYTVWGYIRPAVSQSITLAPTS